MADQLAGLATAMIEQAKKDLASQDDYLALRTAKYFFLEPAKGDHDDLTRFAGLCAATGVDTGAAVRAIFNELLPDKKKHIYSLLRSAGYNIRAGKLLPAE